MKTMKAIVAKGYGTPDVFQLQEVEKPHAKANEVLVKVQAASVTTADGMIRTGKPYFGRLITGVFKPKHPIPGTGFAGVVEHAGAAVKNFAVGDRVFGETTLGFSTNAEYVTIPENGVLAKMPDNLSYAEAAGFCDGHLTSWNFLKKIAQLEAGEKILINGASGSLGTAAVQLAKYKGAEVTAVCSTRNIGLVKSLGADHTIDYTQQDFTNNNGKFDFVFDTVGKSSFAKCRKILAPTGQYLSPVLNFGLLLQMLFTAKLGKQKAKFAATGLLSEEELRKLLLELIEIYKEGKLHTVIDRQYPLEKTAEAHRYIATGRKKGNVVVMMEE